MLTKFILHTATVDHELGPGDLKNWDDVKVSYARSSYDGVVRSFSSKFEFTGEARELLLGIYLRDGFMADVSIEAQVIGNDWKYEKVFESPLDFSTLTFDDYTFSINAIDNTIAAVIKANKKTKYEFAVGTDIKSDRDFQYDRIPMQETATFGFTQGESQGDGSIVVNFQEEDRSNAIGAGYVGLISDETYLNNTLSLKDENAVLDDYCIEVFKDAKVSFDYSFIYDRSYYHNHNRQVKSLEIFLRVRHKDDTPPTVISLGKIITDWAQSPFFEGVYENIPEDTYIYGNYLNIRSRFCVYNNYVYYADPEHIDTYTWRFHFEFTGLRLEEFRQQKLSGAHTLELKAGDKIDFYEKFDRTPTISYRYDCYVHFIESSFKFLWGAIGDPVSIPALTVTNVGQTLIEKLCGSSANGAIQISDYDPRIADTLVLSSESIRGIEGAKLYSSFNDFCDWMETVFGYVYAIGETRPSPYTGGIVDVAVIQDIPSRAQRLYDTKFNGLVIPGNIFYISSKGKFYYRDVYGDAEYYSIWEGSQAYNDPATNMARTDIVMRDSEGNLFTVGDYESGGSAQSYDKPAELVYKPVNIVRFLHRSELFSSRKRNRIKEIKELKYSIESSMIYSEVNIGYQKREYESINGRDEFNFNNTYVTGCTVSDRSLKLQSPYRADCYGIEFAVQKRGEDTTDSSADKDVFFVLVKETEIEQTVDEMVSEDDESSETIIKKTVYLPDRSITISGALNDKVFNGAFSPMACIEANKGYISLQASHLLLSFASSEGNSDITIGGVKMSSDITIDEDMLTNGVVEFTCGEADDIPDVNELISVESGGILYTGFLKSVDIRYPKEEEVKYKLLVKTIEK